MRYAAYPEPERKHKRPRPINLREESYQSYLRELQG
ncbi:hypothetical protein HNP46_000094 [Pseudomonas nitritireducens]|uniref:Uncharacterized protein n=1 Tax=Pseudomonas nitroreducens TaxID=46680 RepID=A0A7W7KFH4_PSENT|nr:hypothetical protein [Pseudomonas nitritireducens]